MAKGIWEVVEKLDEDYEDCGVTYTLHLRNKTKVKVLKCYSGEISVGDVVKITHNSDGIDSITLANGNEVAIIRLGCYPRKYKSVQGGRPEDHPNREFRNVGGSLSVRETFWLGKRGHGKLMICIDGWSDTVEEFFKDMGNTDWEYSPIKELMEEQLKDIMEKLSQ